MTSPALPRTVSTTVDPVGKRASTSSGRSGKQKCAAWCASGAADGVLALWDTAELPPRCTSRLQAHESDVRALALTDDGLLLASAGGDG